MQMNKEETPFCAIQQEIIRVGSLPVKPLKAWKCMKLYTFRFHWIKETSSYGFIFHYFL